MPPTASGTLNLDLAVYRLSAIKKAAYRLSDRAAIQIGLATAGTAEVTIDSANPAINFQTLKQEFLREVTDQELREVVMEETAGVRNLLLAQAFSAMSLFEVTNGPDDYLEDPLQISQPDSAPG